MNRRIAATLLATLAACGEPERSDPDRAALARAARWLWNAQDRDGGWHSATYGLLRDGISLTALVLATLSAVPRDVAAPPHGAIERAVGFLLRSVDARGCLGGAGPVPDYPNYATALAIVALERLRLEAPMVARMRAYLRGQQFNSGLGYAPADAAFGGFGMGGAPRPAPDHGHLDLSMTRHVIEAFAGRSTEPITDPALQFLRRAQGADGGFCFSPAIAGVNKAGAGTGGFVSYGTTTADGLLALLALGVPDDDSRVAHAAAWLRTHYRADRVPGFATDNAWSRGLWFYWAASSSRALAALGGEDGWRAAILAQLRARQAADGSWRNAEIQVKEDDPLIATSLAMQALLAAMR